MYSTAPSGSGASWFRMVILMSRVVKSWLALTLRMMVSPLSSWASSMILSRMSSASDPP